MSISARVTSALLKWISWLLALVQFQLPLLRWLAAREQDLGKPDWEVCSRRAANVLPLWHVRVSPPPCQSDHPAKHAWWGCHVLSAGCFSLRICFCSAMLLPDRGVACGQPTHHSWVPWESWGPGALWWCEIGEGVKCEITATWDLCKNAALFHPPQHGEETPSDGKGV